MSGIIKFSKVVSALPSVLKPSTIYLVRSGTGFDTYLTDSDGLTAYKQNGLSSSETLSLIDQNSRSSFLLMGV